MPATACIQGTVPTVGTSQAQTAKGRPAIAGMPATVGTPKNSTSVSRDANSSRDARNLYLISFAEWRKIIGKRHKKK
jgi:hypothetical protein